MREKYKNELLTNYSKEFIFDLYINKNMSKSEISNYTGLKEYSINFLLNYYFDKL